MFIIDAVRSLFGWVIRGLSKHERATSEDLFEMKEAKKLCLKQIRAEKKLLVELEKNINKKMEELAARKEEGGQSAILSEQEHTNMQQMRPFLEEYKCRITDEHENCIESSEYTIEIYQLMLVLEIALVQHLKLDCTNKEYEVSLELPNAFANIKNAVIGVTKCYMDKCVENKGIMETLTRVNVSLFDTLTDCSISEEENAPTRISSSKSKCENKEILVFRTWC